MYVMSLSPSTRMPERPAFSERHSRRRACVCGRLEACSVYKHDVRPSSRFLALAKQPILLLLAALDLAGRAEVAELAVGPALASARVVIPCAGLAVMWMEAGTLALRRSPM